MAAPRIPRSTLNLLLHTPTPLRPPLLLRHRQRQRPHLRATYHSPSSAPSSPPYREAENSILSASLLHVPEHGFSPQALALGARDAGFRDISANLFPRGAFELVRYHLVTRRLALRGERERLVAEDGGREGREERVSSLTRALLLARLRANAPIVARWPQALGMMSLAENLPASLGELGALGDEVLALAGDVAVDGTWYARRAAVAAVYASAEVFQTTDGSDGFRDTEGFLDRRLGEVRGLGKAVGGFGEWVGFQAGAVVGVLRSKGVRI